MSDPTLPPSSTTAPLGYQSGLAGGIESSPTERSTAMIAHILGLLGILGTGIWYLVKKNDPAVGPFARDQMKEAFNFHLAVLVALIIFQVLASIIIGVTGSGLLAILFGLVSLAIYIAVIALLVVNAIKANKGILARYPVKIPAIK